MRTTNWINTFSRKLAILLLVSVLFSLQLGNGRQALAAGLDARAESRNILVVYSAWNEAIDASVRTLDLALGHFANKLTFKSDAAVTNEDIRDVTHLVYYGAIEKELPQTFKQIFSAYQGSVLALGHNVEQLPNRFSFMKLSSKDEINKVSKTGSDSYELLELNYQIPRVELLEGEVVLQGWKGDQSTPLMVMHEDSAYYALPNVEAPFVFYLGEALHTYFHERHQGRRLAYIRLEDVHPYSDPALVRETGEYLASKNIPFMIAVIPVYTNEKTRQQHFLNEMPELVEVLNDLQKKGGAILQHGYTHQYRASETGEGFEFWDVENNIPISANPDQPVDVRKRTDFASQEEFVAHRKQLRQFDRTYTEDRLKSGIEQLTRLGLYPYGFEAPHYTMSQDGYRTTSEYYTYLLGQTQMGDVDWRQMSTAPYITRPSFLNGMTMLPETIGYFDPESPSPLEDIEASIRQMMFVEDGMMGMFYHPYLGVENLEMLISKVETIPDLQWLDIRTMTSTTSTKFQAVDRSNEPVVKVTLNPIQYALQGGTVQAILWGVTALVSIMVTAFALYTIRIRMSRRKQLFEERNASG